jgi:hypothetical protein
MKMENIGALGVRPPWISRPASILQKETVEMKGRDAKSAFFERISRTWGTYALGGFPQLHSGMFLFVPSCKVSSDYIL